MEKIIITRKNLNDFVPYMEQMFNIVLKDKTQKIGIDIGSPPLKEKNLDTHSTVLDEIADRSWFDYFSQFKDKQYFITEHEYKKDLKKWSKVILNKNTCVFIAIGNYIEVEDEQEFVEIYIDNIKNYGFNIDKEVVVFKPTISNKNKKDNELTNMMANELQSFLRKFQKPLTSVKHQP